MTTLLSPLSRTYTSGRHVPVTVPGGAGISLYPVSSCLSK